MDKFSIVNKIILTLTKLEMQTVEQLNHAINKEMDEAVEKWGKYHNTHEFYAVLLEEVEEFWDSVKKNEPDFYELIQVIAVAKRAIIEFCDLK